MARGSEGLVHAALGAGEDVAGRAHGAADEHRLARQLVVDRNERMVRREGARRALAVHQQRLRPAVHHVLLHFGDVVRHVCAGKKMERAQSSWTVALRTESNRGLP